MLDEALAQTKPGGSRQGGGRRAQMARHQMIRLDATATAGHPLRSATRLASDRDTEPLIPVLT